MPVYLLHGFRWPRDGFSGIRVHAIVHNLEDCSVEYIQNTNSHEDLRSSFRKNFPELMKELENNGRTLEFIEQYDPDDETFSAVSQPYAYIADKVVELAGQTIASAKRQSTQGKPKQSGPPLSVNVEEVIADGPGLTARAWEALADLRDQVAPGEKIGWWVVYNGDPERAYDSDGEEGEEDQEEEEEEDDEEATTPTAGSASAGTWLPTASAAPPAPPKDVRRGSATTHLPQEGPSVPPKTSASKSSSSFGSKLLPTRSKQDTVKPLLVKPEAVLPTPKEEKIPEPPRLKEVAKTGGFRKKFFGKKI